MRSTSSPGKLSLREVAILSLMAAVIFASKVAMSMLPNIHLVAVLLMLCTVGFGWKAMYTVFIYVMLEGLVYGMNIWWIPYLYIWPLLVVLTMVVRHTNSYWMYAILAGCFGLLFGAMCAIVTAVTSGVEAAIVWWQAGIPYDLIHGVSNFIITLVVLPPLDKVFRKYLKRQ